MAKNKNNNIDKAMQALGDALKIEEIGKEIQLPGEEVSTEEQGYEIAEMADGGAEINFDPNAMSSSLVQLLLLFSALAIFLLLILGS